MIQHTDAEGFTFTIVSEGERVACCGCVMIRADHSDLAWLDCPCRCHEGSKLLYRATAVHSQASS